MSLLFNIAHKNVLLLILDHYSMIFLITFLYLAYSVLNMYTEYSVYNLVLSFCFLLHVPFVLIHLTATTIIWSTGMRVAKEEDEELSFTFFPFPL